MKFEVVLNWYGEIHTFEINNSSEQGALRKAIEKLALKLKITRYAVRQHIYSGNKITIKEK